VKIESRVVTSEIPTSSMADIAFLLVIYFMLTITFAATQGLDVGLPPEVKNDPIDPLESVLVEVQPDGLLRVDQRAMPLAGLLPYLEPKLRRNPQKPVIVRAADGTPYGAVVNVLDELRQGRERLGLAEEIRLSLPTEREAQGWERFVS
jgi:biopolymer transport protein ExbD